MNSELRSLLSLLDDPDDHVYQSVFEKLCEYGPAVIPSLEEEWLQNNNLTFQKRVESLIHSIQFDKLKADLKVWCLQDSKNLLEGMLIVNGYFFPDQSITPIKKELDLLKHEIRTELNYQLTPLEHIRTINSILFDRYKFSPKLKDINNPNNSTITYILNSRKSNPIGLGLLYLILAEELRLPVFGVCLPNFFTLCFVDTAVWNSDPTMINAKDILFYINPFNKGSLFGVKEILAYLNRMDLPIIDRYFQPCSHIEIINQLLEVIHNDLMIQNQTAKAMEIKELKKLLR